MPSAVNGPEPLEVVTDIGRLAEIVNGNVRGADLYATGSRLRTPVVVQGIDLDELVLDAPGAAYPVIFSHCRIRHLRVMDALVPDGISFEDSTIEILDARSWRRGRLGVLRCRLEELRMHAVPEVTIAHSTIRAGVMISDVRARLDLTSVRCGELVIESEQATGEVRIEAYNINVGGSVQVRNVRASTMRFADCDAAEFRIQRVRVPFAALEDCRIRGTIRIHLIASESDAKLQLLARAAGEVELRGTWLLGQPNASSVGKSGTDDAWALVVDGSRFVACDDVQLIGPVRLDLRATRIDGTLRIMPSQEGAGRCVLDEDSAVNAVVVGAKPLRTASDARRTAQALFGAADSTELALLHKSLEGRPDEQDVAYYAQRVAETRACHGWRRVAGVLRGALLGWGVRLLQPIRALLVGVLATAVVLHASGASRTADEPLFAIRPVARAFVVGASLWFNVGTGLPFEQHGVGWSAAAVSFTVLGIIFVTVAVGVAIRRLVR